MDLSKRKFKIVDKGALLTIHVEVPKYKKKWAFNIPWWPFPQHIAYYDEQDLQWAVVSTRGTLMYNADDQYAAFKNVTQAREFIALIQNPPKVKETVIEPKEAKMVTLKQNAK